jgi:frataxin
MNENTFNQLADQEIALIREKIEENDINNDFDIDIIDEVLYVDTPTGDQYVVSKHTPSTQLWISSPVSGATHYEYDTKYETWVSTKDSSELHELLQDELSDYVQISFD